MTRFGPAERRPVVPALVRGGGHLLEDRVVPTVTLFVDFGDGFGPSGINVTVDQLAAGGAGALAGPDLSGFGFAGDDVLNFSSSRATVMSAGDLNGDTLVNEQDYIDFKRNVMFLVQRYYEPFNVVVQETASSSVAGIVAAMQANNGLGTAAGINDAYVFFTSGRNVTQDINLGTDIGLFGIAGVDPSFGNSTPAVNTGDNVVIGDAGAHFSPGEAPWQETLNSANTIVHEAGHSFGLYHVSPIDEVAFSDLIPSGGVPVETYYEFIFATRYPLPLSPFEGLGTEQNTYDRLADFGLSNIGARSDASLLGAGRPNQFGLGGHYVTGTGVADQITIAANGDIITVTVTPDGETAFSYDVSNTGQGLLIETGLQGDTVTFSGAIRGPIVFRGMDGVDTIAIDAAGQAVSFTPGPTIGASIDQEQNYTASATVGAATYFMSELRSSSAVAVSNAASVSYRPPAAASEIIATESGGVVSFAGTRINGAAPLLLTVSGATTIDIGLTTASAPLVSAITVNNSGGLTSASLSGDINYVVTGGTINYGGGGVAFNNISNIGLNGGAGSSTFTVTGPSRTLTLNGGGGNDAYFLSFGPTGSATVTASDSSGDDSYMTNFAAGSAGQFVINDASGNDRLDSFGSAAAPIVISGSTVTSGSETVTTSGLETVIVNGTAGNDLILVNGSATLASQVVGVRSVGGSDTLNLSAGSSPVGIELGTGVLVSGLTGFGGPLRFDGLARINVTGNGSTPVQVRDYAGARGSALNPLAGAVYRPAGPNSGEMFFGSLGGPSLGFFSAGSLDYQGDAGNNGGRDALTVLGTADGQSPPTAFAETRLGSGADNIVVNDRRTTVSSSVGAMLGLSYNQFGLQNLLVRGGNEATGDRFRVEASATLAILIDGGLPAQVPGDQLTVLTVSPLNPTEVNNPALGPPQTLVTDPITGESVGFVNIDSLVFQRFELENRIAVGVDAGGPPIATMYSSFSRSPIFSVMAFPPSFTGGVRVATGDVNGDGIADLIAVPGAGAGPIVRVFDGVTGQLIRSFLAYDPGMQTGMFVASADVDGDGFGDIVTSTDFGSAPHVKAFSGRNGLELRSFFAYDPAFTGGVRLAAGDIDGDGRGDIVTGTSFGAAHVKVISGRTRTESQSFFAYDPAFLGGVWVGTGDVDGDGTSDLVTGTGIGGTPHIKAFATTGRQLASFFDVDPTPVELNSGQLYQNGNPRTGVASQALSPIPVGSGARVAVGDVNDDLSREIIVTRGSSNLPSVRAYRPAGQLVTEFDAFAGASGFGVFVGANQ